MRRFDLREYFASGAILFSARQSMGEKDGQDLKDAFVNRVFELVWGKCPTVAKAGSY